MCYIERCAPQTLAKEINQSPKIVGEALKGPGSGKLKLAMDSEMNGLKENRVYELVDRPEGKKVVKPKWVLRVKTNAKSKIEIYKAQVVAKRYDKIQGVDYDQTFSPTVRFESIRQMVALGASKGSEMHQMDLTTASRYAPLEKEVYME